ncbi:MAG: VOC family protein [Gemmatimonadaceae bacterium]
MQAITPFLWFNDQAEDAMNYYVAIFPNSRVKNVTRYGENMPRPAGTVMTANFELNGVEFVALNGGPQFNFTEAVSFVVSCDTQAEVDRYWNSLTANGGQPSQCGWLKDKYGLSWQIVPKVLSELLTDKDQAKAKRVTAALMKMSKLDIAALQNA